MRLQVVALAILLSVFGSGAAKDTGAGKRQRWKPVGEHTVPLSSLATVPADSAGCLVVGYYITSDGTVAEARIMQGAYTKNVPEAAQKEISDTVSAAPGRWRFRRVGHGAPLAAFDWTVVGFHNVEGHAAQPILRLGLPDPRVRSSCEISSLGEWGNARAISVEAAKAAKHDKILALYAQPVEAFWADATEKSVPRYPRIAYEAGVAGCVVVGMLVALDGRPEKFWIVKAELTRSSAPIRKALEDASLHTASTWSFLPGPDNPDRLPAFVQIPVDFAIGSPSDMDCAPVDPKHFLEPKG